MELKIHSKASPKYNVHLKSNCKWKLTQNRDRNVNSSFKCCSELKIPLKIRSKLNFEENVQSEFLTFGFAILTQSSSKLQFVNYENSSVQNTILIYFYNK